MTPENTHTRVKTTVNFVDAVRTNWQLLVTLFSLIVAIVGIFFRVGVSEAQIQQNKQDIKELQVRVNSVEGDIKAIKEGIDFIKDRVK